MFLSGLNISKSIFYTDLIWIETDKCDSSWHLKKKYNAIWSPPVYIWSGGEYMVEQEDTPNTFWLKRQFQLTYLIGFKAIADVFVRRFNIVCLFNQFFDV